MHSFTQICISVKVGNLTAFHNHRMALLFTKYTSFVPRSVMPDVLYYVNAKKIENILIWQTTEGGLPARYFYKHY